MRDRGPGLPGGVAQAVLLLLVVAAGARAAYELLAPLVPLLLAIAVLSVVTTGMFRR